MKGQLNLVHDIFKIAKGARRGFVPAQMAGDAAEGRKALCANDSDS